MRLRLSVSRKQRHVLLLRHEAFSSNRRGETLDRQDHLTSRGVNTSSPLEGRNPVCSSSSSITHSLTCSARHGSARLGSTRRLKGREDIKSHFCCRTPSAHVFKMSESDRNTAMSGAATPAPTATGHHWNIWWNRRVPPPFPGDGNLRAGSRVLQDPEHEDVLFLFPLFTFQQISNSHFSCRSTMQYFLLL
ncbi:unnamed protein product [Pleuronectes platessa]|uniref:Uncharacterized protein n=1 Tax=Pleuronectes platessa TaxID=8262 RepID=A0A9N7UKW5_PLEPL|nr:unnamed protein product [Pleuronectes platessa]